MAETLRTDDLDRLVLVWLAVPRKRPSLASLAGVLAPFVRGTGADPESIARQSLARLEARRDIEGDTTWMLSPAGRQKALDALGIAELPKRTSWKAMYDLLVARGQGSELTPAVRRRVTNAGQLAAMVLERHHGIRGRSTLSKAQVARALAWRELGVESTEPFTVKAVLAHVLEKAHGVSTALKDTDAALVALASAALGVPRGAAPIRAALVRRWMAAPSREAEAAAPQEKPPAAADPAALRSFSERALDAARGSQTGRWGEHKVFVSHVWSEYRRRNDGDGPADLGAFKLMLVRANQAGLLSLSRADLVEEMDAGDVKRSEIASLGATFHFVRVG